MIDLHYVASPNGLKIGFLLEELELPYRVVTYEIFAGDHLTPAFRILNPNHKLPVIVDQDPADAGAPVTVFETGAIMLYLAEKTGCMLPTDIRRRSLVQQWLVWQVAGLGPMHGQASHFLRYAPKGEDYAIERYTREALRLLNVLEFRLLECDYLAGEYSIADLAALPWVMGASILGFDIGKYGATSDWCTRLLNRPAIRRAMDKDELKIPAHYLRERAGLNAEEWSNLFGDRMHAAAAIL